MQDSKSAFIVLTLIAEAFIIYASVLVKISDIPPIMLGFYRVFLALPVFALFYIKSKNLCLPHKKDLLLMILSGVFFGLDLLFFNLALHHTSVANVNLICSTACLVLVPIGIIFFKQKLYLSFVLGSMIAIIGAFILIKGRSDLSVASPFGDFLAFLSMLSYAIFLALIYNLRRCYRTLQIMFYSGIGACLFLLVLGCILEGFVIPQDSYQWFLCILIAFFGQVVGQGFFGYIMGRMNIQLYSLLLLFSPAIAAILGYLILDEYLGVIEIFGICVIVLGVFIAQRRT
ncbi:MAG: DMT family transporter [Helicobacter sp.]|nr:DMT family transporter [Helicobacter sp.]MDD7567017.1 DMT family transporter [Helicobacter sp.]MDY5741218.1 DMT family transporter [Helicobacter sp.]